MNDVIYSALTIALCALSYWLGRGAGEARNAPQPRDSHGRFQRRS